MKIALLSVLLAVTTTSQLLELGVIEMSLGNTREAIMAFEGALDRRSLTKPGRALVYWHLQSLYKDYIWRKRLANEYLMMFITQSEEIIAAVDDANGVHRWNLFVKTQNLRRKVKESKIILDKMWEKSKWKNSLKQQSNNLEKAPTKSNSAP